MTRYSKTSTGQGATSGTGDLYWWNASLNGGLGDWVLAQSGVGYTINFYDSGKSGKSSADTFGIRIVYTPVAPQPSTLPNSTPQLLQGGTSRFRKAARSSGTHSSKKERNQCQPNRTRLLSAGLSSRS